MTPPGERTSPRARSFKLPPSLCQERLRPTPVASSLGNLKFIAIINKSSQISTEQISMHFKARNIFMYSF